MKKILVADDDCKVRQFLKLLLLKEGYKVDEAGDGKEVLELIESEVYDLLVLDMVMPEANGIDAMLKIMREYPDLKVIAISGGGRVKPESYLRYAENMGAVKSYCKPLDIQAFSSGVRELLSDEDYASLNRSGV